MDIKIQIVKTIRNVDIFIASYYEDHYSRCYHLISVHMAGEKTGDSDSDAQ